MTVACEEVFRMALRNCELIDPESGKFSFLDLVTFHLSGPYWWKNDDFNSEQGKVSVFRAYAREDDHDLEPEVASVTIADATLDPTEPDVSALQETDVPAIDRTLLEGTEAQLIAEGRTMVRWMSSKLNQTDRIKGLVTVYIVGEHGQQRQCIALRLTSKARKIVVIGVFDLAKKDALASLIFGLMRDMVVLP